MSGLSKKWYSFLLSSTVEVFRALSVTEIHFKNLPRYSYTVLCLYCYTIVASLFAENGNIPSYYVIPVSHKTLINALQQSPTREKEGFLFKHLTFLGYCFNVFCFIVKLIIAYLIIVKLAEWPPVPIKFFFLERST